MKNFPCWLAGTTFFSKLAITQTWKNTSNRNSVRKVILLRLAQAKCVYKCANKFSYAVQQWTGLTCMLSPAFFVLDIVASKCCRKLTGKFNETLSWATKNRKSLPKTTGKEKGKKTTAKKLLLKAKLLCSSSSSKSRKCPRSCSNKTERSVVCMYADKTTTTTTHAIVTIIFFLYNPLVDRRGVNLHTEQLLRTPEFSTRKWLTAFTYVTNLTLSTVLLSFRSCNSLLKSTKSPSWTPYFLQP